MIDIYRASQLLISVEVLSQVTVVVTEAFSNSQYRKFPISEAMMGFSGQSLLVIIVAILIMIMSLLVLRNLGRILVRTSWKISVSCIGFSLASIAFRTFSSNFLVSSTSTFYVSTYNITSYLIVISAVLWIPFMFCKSDKYQPPPPPDAERHRIRSTGGNRVPFTHRPHQDEDNQSIESGPREELPSYYEMMPPPTYKNSNRQNRNGNRDSSASTQDVDTYVHNDTTEPIIYPTTNNDHSPTPSINNAVEADDRSPPPSINAVYMQDANDERYSPSSVVINIDENSSSVPDSNNVTLPPPNNNFNTHDNSNGTTSVTNSNGSNSNTNRDTSATAEAA